MNLLLLFFLTISFKVQAEDIKCFYNFKNKEIIFKNITKPTRFEKFENGLKYEAVIKDLKNLSELDNYLVISQDDKKITYSLSCQKI